MSNREDHITNLTPELMQQYLKGSLTSEMEYQVERYLLDHPFEAEAMEGVGTVGVAGFESDVADLKNKLISKKKETKVIPIWQRYWKVAAAVTLLVISTFLILEMNWTSELSTNELAVNDEKTTESNFERDKEASPLQSDADEISTEEPGQTTLIDEEVSPLLKEIENQSSTGNKIAPQIASTELEKDALIAYEEVEKEVQEDNLIIEEIKRITDDVPNQEVVVEQKLSPVSLDTNIAKALSGTVSGIRISKKTQKGSSLANVNTKMIKGKITSEEDGSPLPGVNVIISGTIIGTITDIEGNYQLIVPEGQELASYSFIGYVNEVVEIGDRNVIDLALSADIQMLSEVVVTGKGLEHSTESIAYAVIEKGKNKRKKAAQPIGGFESYQDYLKSTLKYPQEALDNNISGAVIVEFTITKKGKFINFYFIKKLGYGCDEEAVRLINEGPKWKPGTKRGKTIKEVVRVEVVFDD